jgi:hypothetical protein
MQTLTLTLGESRPQNLPAPTTARDQKATRATGLLALYHRPPLHGKKAPELPGQGTLLRRTQAQGTVVRPLDGGTLSHG